jgi:hypothetical protein
MAKICFDKFEYYAMLWKFWIFLTNFKYFVTSTQVKISRLMLNNIAMGFKQNEECMIEKDC